MMAHHHPRIKKLFTIKQGVNNNNPEKKNYIQQTPRIRKGKTGKNRKEIGVFTVI